MFITKLHVHTPSQMKPLADWFVYFGWFEFFTSNKKLTMSHKRLSKVKAKNMHPIGLDLVISVSQSNTLHSRPQPFRHCLSLKPLTVFFQMNLIALVWRYENLNEPSWYQRDGNMHFHCELPVTGYEMQLILSSGRVMIFCSGPINVHIEEVVPLHVLFNSQ